MEHPFVNNLKDKSLEELQNTISSLTSKLNFAYRTGNTSLITQLTMAIESYKNAYQEKMSDLIKKQNITAQIKIDKKN